MKILALANAYKDSELARNSNSRSIPSTPRTDASIRLLAELKNNRDLSTTVEQMELMCTGNCLKEDFFD